MSTDLELRLPIIKINPSSQTSDDESCVIQRCINQEKEEEEEDQCHTPKSPAHIIPVSLCCPPAPKKPRRAPSCKRKLSELNFFEMISRDEIESFFRLVEVNFNGATKRKCVM